MAGYLSVASSDELGEGERASSAEKLRSLDGYIPAAALEQTHNVEQVLIKMPRALFSPQTMRARARLVHGSVKEWSLGFVKRAPATRGGQEAGMTLPRDHSLEVSSNR